MLDVGRRGEQPTDLLRAQNNRQAARLAGRDELLGKIVAFQCDFDLPPEKWTPSYADFASARSGVM